MPKEIFMNNKTNTEIICETIVVVAYYALVFALIAFVSKWFIIMLLFTRIEL